MAFNKSERVNLSSAEVMLACGDPEGLNILAEMFHGFGVHTPRRCGTLVEAKTSVQERILNLMVVDSALADAEGYDFIRWLRRSEIAPNCYAPVILITGHTKPSQIFRGRDSGASFVVRKPVAPLVMMQRI
ncbi:MAG TPA: response regulator, partial [Phenylobacterium sp.]|nr:response regulator [Phenylobacterium sp.]